jgi:hypothetical protein
MVTRNSGNVRFGDLDVYTSKQIFPGAKSCTDIICARRHIFNHFKGLSTKRS